MSAFSRNKGARAEREFCKLASDYLGGKYTRNLKQYQCAQHGDVEQLVGPYLVEVKNCAELRVAEWWKQACSAAAAKGARPCLAYKLARQGWRFVVPSRDALLSGGSWAWDYRYTATYLEEGFFLHVREQLGG